MIIHYLKTLCLTPAILASPLANQCCQMGSARSQISENGKAAGHDSIAVEMMGKVW